MSHLIQYINEDFKNLGIEASVIPNLSMCYMVLVFKNKEDKNLYKIAVKVKEDPDMLNTSIAVFFSIKDTSKVIL